LSTNINIEFGYYFNCVKENRKIDFDEFIIKLINGYEDFLKNNITNKFVILGINPTLIKDIHHNFRVSFRCPNGEKALYSQVNYEINFDDVKECYNDAYQVRFEKNKL